MGWRSGWSRISEFSRDNVWFCSDLRLMSIVKTGTSKIRGEYTSTWAANPLSRLQEEAEARGGCRIGAAEQLTGSLR